MSSSTAALTLSSFLYVPAMINMTMQSFRTKIISKPVDIEYDYVIVGGGSAGCVVANRLSENQDVTVLLLEAGGDETVFSDIPLLAQHLQLAEMDWAYRTVPQKGSCLSLTNKESPWPRGKLIGGSSSINYMLYGRGNRRDYDNWENLGNPGWSYEKVLPYFLKSEDYQMEINRANQKYHRKGGYLSVEFPKWKNKISQAVIEGAKDMGYDQVDYNGVNQTGVNDCYVTTRDGTRCSTAKAFIKSVQHKRPNLVVSLKSHAEKILINPNTKTAVGVRFTKDGVRRKVFARKEVIVSCGAIASPQMLMLSGIGPKKHLEDLNIRVIQDLPGVGQSLNDHVTTFGMVYIVDQPIDLRLERMLTEENLSAYGLRGEGPLTVPGGVHAFGYFKSKFANASDDWPDVQLMVSLGSVITDPTLRYNFGVSDEAWEKYYAPHVGKDTITLFPLLMRPQSTGEIKLKTKNPYDYPLIDPKYFRVKRDLDALVEGTKIIATLGNTVPFQKLGAKLIHYPGLPGCENESEVNDKYWRCLLTALTMSDYKQSCTCKMGPDSDPMAVLDSRLRVRGIKKLRVVDASIMPELANGPVNAPIIMIAEKASDMIKEDNA